MIDARRRELIRRLPKAELHLHLEGSIRPTTLLELARRRRIDLPASDAAGLREWFRFRDFQQFVEIYVTCSSCLREPEDFQLVIRELAREQARQRIVYSEVHFTIGTHLMQGGRGDEILDALWEATQEAEEKEGVVLRWIPDIVRNVPWKWADATVEWALDGRSRGVVALGLSGIENGYPNDPFRAHFEAARQEGLRRTVHAGEHAGPESVRSAISDCQAERIGHGVRAIEDPELVDDLASAGIPLEVCPTSNVCLGVFDDLVSHPIDRLDRAGVQVTLNSDDPPLFGTTLTDEYERIAATFDLGSDRIVELVRRGFEHAFLDRDSIAGHLERVERVASATG